MPSSSSDAANVHATATRPTAAERGENYNETRPPKRNPEPAVQGREGLDKQAEKSVNPEDLTEEGHP